MRRKGRFACAVLPIALATACASQAVLPGPDGRQLIYFMHDEPAEIVVNPMAVSHRDPIPLVFADRRRSGELRIARHPSSGRVLATLNFEHDAWAYVTCHEVSWWLDGVRASWQTEHSGRDRREHVSEHISFWLNEQEEVTRWRGAQSIRGRICGDDFSVPESWLSVVREVLSP